MMHPDKLTKLMGKVGKESENDRLNNIDIEARQFETSIEKKTYIFTKKVKRWDVEAGDYYNEQRHIYKGGKEQLLAERVIEKEE